MALSCMCLKSRRSAQAQQLPVDLSMFSIHEERSVLEFLQVHEKDALFRLYITLSHIVHPANLLYLR